MLSNLTVENFKLHESTTIDFAPVTVFIGPNNSGKSSLGQALLLLRSAAENGSANLCMPVYRSDTSSSQPFLFSATQSLDVGTFEEVKRRGQPELTIRLGGTVTLRMDKSAASDSNVGFSCVTKNNLIVHHEGHVDCLSSIGPGELKWRWTAGSPLKSPGLVIGAGHIAFHPQANYRFLSVAGINPEPNATPQRQVTLNELANELAMAPTRLLQSLRSVHPLRGFEESGFPLTDAPANSIDRIALPDRAVALLSMLAYDLSLQERLSDWLNELLRIRIKVKLLPGKRVTLVCTPSGQRDADTVFANEGTGAGQLPFILVPIGMTSPNETILLSEPEAHLHPKAQTDLVALLIRIKNEQKRQFVLETHSEHVLHALLHNVATGVISPDDLAIYYFNRVGDQAVAKRLSIDNMGRVEGGLPGFFEQSLSELSDYLEALKKN